MRLLHWWHQVQHGILHKAILLKSHMLDFFFEINILMNWWLRLRPIIDRCFVSSEWKICKANFQSCTALLMLISLSTPKNILRKQGIKPCNASWQMPSGSKTSKQYLYHLDSGCNNTYLISVSLWYRPLNGSSHNQWQLSCAIFACWRQNMPSEKRRTLSNMPRQLVKVG